MKILMILPEFYPEMGGTEIQAFQLCKALQKANAKVDVLTRMSNRDLKRDEIIGGLIIHRIDYPRIRLIGGLMLNLGYTWQLITNYKSKDIVHFHIGGTHMIIPLIISKIIRKPTLLKISGWWEMDTGFLKLKGFYSALLRNILFNSDRIIAVSDEIKNRLITLGYPNNRIVCFPNGVDTSRFYPDAGEMDEKKFKLVFVGRLVKEKGIPFLIESVKELKNEFPEISLDIVGSGKEENHLMDLVKMMNLTDRVLFHGKRDDVENMLRKAGIFVQSSITEGLPNSLLEAMACGLPVIVTNVGGMPDIVVDGQNGFVVEPGNVGKLTEKIRTLIHDAALKEKFSINNVNLIRNNYSLDLVAAKYMGLYQFMLAK